MKIITLSKILVISSFILLSSVFAQNGTPRGGGLGVQIGEEVMTLDLYESGIKEEPIVERDYGKKAKINKYDLINDFYYLNVLKYKFNQIKVADKSLAWALKQASEMYNWAFVDSELCSVPDVNSVLNLYNIPTKQLAVRQNKMIRINKQLWSKMNDTQKSALVLHELVYSLLLSKESNKGKSELQLSAIARDIVQFLFSDDFNCAPERLHEFASNYLPLSDQTLLDQIRSSYFMEYTEAKNIRILSLKMEIALAIKKKGSTKIAGQFHLNYNKASANETIRFYDTIAKLATPDMEGRFTVTYTGPSISWNEYNGMEYPEWRNSSKNVIIDDSDEFIDDSDSPSDLDEAKKGILESVKKYNLDPNKPFMPQLLAKLAEETEQKINDIENGEKNTENEPND